MTMLNFLPEQLGRDNYFVARSRGWSCTWTYNQETAGPESRPGCSHDRKKVRLLTSFLGVQVNPVRSKELNNIRAAGKDENVRLTPPRMILLEEAIGYVAGDELIEVLSLIRRA
jgi:hypothetical protein